MKTNRNAGVTLVELLVAVAVIAILATIAIPAYQNQAQKARRTDGRAALANLALAQERFFTVNGTYIGGTDTDTSAAGDSFQRLDLDASLTVNHQSIVSENGYYSIGQMGNFTATTYTATATPVSGQGQDNDGDCTAMTITHLGVKGGSPSNNKCW